MVSGHRPGLSLAEVAVAMVVLGTGLLSVLALFGHGASLLRLADVEEGAAREAANVLDSLTALGAPAGGAATRGQYRLRWTATPDSLGVTLLTLEVRYEDGRLTRADTFHAQAAPWPRQVDHAP